LTNGLSQKINEEAPQWKSKWLQRLAQEKVEKAERLAKEKKDKEESLRNLLWEWQDKEDKYGNEDLTGQGLFDYLKKIDNHL